MRPSGRMSCPVLLFDAQNLRYAYNVLTVVVMVWSLTFWMLAEPPRSLAETFRIMSHVCASRSAARNTLPSTLVIGIAIVCTRMRRSPRTVVYSSAHCTYASPPSFNRSS